METFTQKCRKIEKLREDIDSHIWNIFSMYLKETGKLFSSPDDWYIDGNSINFYGEDGCMGCYDNMNLSIPMKFFEEPETSFDEMKLEKMMKEQEEAERKRLAKEQKERDELKRLKEKYDE